MFVVFDPILVVVDPDLGQGQIAIVVVHGYRQWLYAIGSANAISIVSVLFDKRGILEDGVLLLLVSNRKPSHIGEEGVGQIHQG